MTLDRELMRSVHEKNITPAAERVFGAVGRDLARRMLSGLPTVHSHMPVELLPDGLTVFAPADDAFDYAGFGEEVYDLSTVQVHPFRQYAVAVTPGGFRVRPGPVPLIPEALVYRFDHPRTERWHLGDEVLPVFNPIVAWPSSFATPLFTELEQALKHYAAYVVQECRCSDLERAWLDDSRLFWAQRPEHHIRRSLERHLVSHLRDGTVVEVEHVVDEWKEVDLVVYWAFSKQMSLIECKWLGVSFSEPDAAGKRKRTEYSDSDAIGGLRQIADYMDLKRKRAAGRTLLGFLVVVDGRRAKAGTPDTSSVHDFADLLAFEHHSIDWPTDLLERPDLASPHRMFCRPKL